MTESKNVDALLAQVTQEQMSAQSIPHVGAIENTEPVSNVAETQPESDANTTSLEQKSEENVPHETPESTKKEEVEAKETKQSSEPIDEYGNPVEKPRLYTEEEVNQRIRERLSRGKYAEQPSPQQIKQDAKDFTPDPNSDDTWEKQLEQFIDHRLETREHQSREKIWRDEQTKIQADFESRFTSGMNKYNDFNEVLRDKPVNDDMMLATRALENPAAFLYGAAKMHPQELDRISRIRDPQLVAVEIGRLHERMVKNRAALSSAAKPLEAPKGDLPATKVVQQKSLEQRIKEHAQQKRR